MNCCLPVVNVLLALLWPRHQSHVAAHAWFAKSAEQNGNSGYSRVAENARMETLVDGERTK
jgi:predicted nucleic acid-binding protein